jgi:hypothetical protein
MKASMRLTTENLATFLSGLTLSNSRRTILEKKCSILSNLTPKAESMPEARNDGRG